MQRKLDAASALARNGRHNLAHGRKPWVLVGRRASQDTAYPGASFRIRFAISIAVTAASKPLLPALPPARLTACSSVSHVSTPKITGTPLSSAARATPLAAAAATWS